MTNRPQLTLKEIAAKADNYAEHLRDPDSLRFALRNMAMLVREHAPAATETGTREGTCGTCPNCRSGYPRDCYVIAARNGTAVVVHPAPAAGDARGEATTISNEESDHG